jgi:predicted NodU family carbamoyl transferase
MRTIYDEIARIGFVNLVHGNMEFGPRALCNTSTLALPDKQVTRLINKANDRTNEMPMAPVVTRALADDLFHDIGKVHRSLEYMIVTRKYKCGADEGMGGASHRYPDGVATGRPQITDDPALCTILNWFGGVLVNTSFNYHGVPIVFERDSIEASHRQQRSRCPELDIKTVVVTGDLI